MSFLRPGFSETSISWEGKDVNEQDLVGDVASATKYVTLCPIMCSVHVIAIYGAAM